MLRFGGPAVPDVRLRFPATIAAARYGFPRPRYNAIDIQKDIFSTQVRQSLLILLRGYQT